MSNGLVVDYDELPYEAQPEYLNGTKKRVWRFPALFLISGFAFANYWCYDLPANLEYAIEYSKEDGGFGVGPTQYGLLYSSFGIPNLFMPILAGIMFDKFGTRLSTLLFATLLCVGQWIYVVGGDKMSFNLLLAGRLVFGFGCCAMYVA
jgi:MFS family permease